MGQIEDLRLFSAVIEHGSISRAAETMHIAKSAVSRRLSLLEQRYGARLINRSPGKWEVTATGRELYQRAINVVQDVDEIENDFTEITQTLAGPLSVSVPRDFGLSFLNPVLIAFKTQYPDIQLLVDFDDRKVDLSRDNYDFAFRITFELEPDMVAKRMGFSELQTLASPSYLARKGVPKGLEDMQNHDLLHYGAAKRSNWLFENAAGKAQVFEFQPTLNSTSGLFLLEAAKKGLGIARLPDFICKTSVDAGDLIPILADLTSPRLGIFLIHSEHRRLNRRMRLFAEEIEAACLQYQHQPVM